MEINAQHRVTDDDHIYVASRSDGTLDLVMVLDRGEARVTVTLDRDTLEILASQALATIGQVL